MADGTRLQTFPFAGAVSSGLQAGGRSDFVVLTDVALRYVHADGAAARWCGAPGQYVLGANARDFFAPPTYARHETQDRLVMRNGKALMSQLDLSMRSDGTMCWANLSRQRVVESDAQYVATSGPFIAAPGRPSLRVLADSMREPFDEGDTLGDLAARAGLSLAQLAEDSEAEFGIALARLATKFRLDRALAMIEAGAPIADAARACGYATQSALSRRFDAVSGMSPTEFCRLKVKLSERNLELAAPNSARQAPLPAYQSR